MTSSISLQLYTLRDAIAEDPAAALARVAELGFRNVELFGLAELGDAYRAGLAANGLAAPSVHASLSAADREASLDAAAEFGARYVLHPFSAPEPWADRAWVDAFAHELNAAAESASTRGIQVGYHNHDGELRNTIDGITSLEHLATRLAPEVIFEIDAYWVHAAGLDAAAFIRNNAERVRLIHVKDGLFTGDAANQPMAGAADADQPAHISEQVVAGTGLVPLTDALAATSALEYAVVEFDQFDGDVFAGIAAGRDYLISKGFAS